jgi:hypothetical protein
MRNNGAVLNLSIFFKPLRSSANCEHDCPVVLLEAANGSLQVEQAPRQRPLKPD